MKQSNMIVKEYSLKLTQLSRYAPHVVADSRSRMTSDKPRVVLAVPKPIPSIRSMAKTTRVSVEQATMCVSSVVGQATELEIMPSQKDLNLHRRRWFELLKDYDMSIQYHPGKANVVDDALIRMSMGSMENDRGTQFFSHFSEAFQKNVGTRVVARNLNHAIFSVALHPVGIDSRVDIIAIYGMGRIGKSTLVKTDYNLNSDKFDGNNVLVDVNKISERHNGLDFFGIPDECKPNLDLKRQESQLLEVIDGNTSIRYNSELNGSDLLEYMDCLGENLNDVLERHRGDCDVSADAAFKPHYVVEPSKHLPSRHSNIVSNDDEIMGFDIEIEKLIRHLTRGTSELDVIPTVGMGEQGKMIISRNE
ncbi:hypothetical protein FXO38_13186 [Capsicum annuum]|nr:hypothetical protein FXO38_13186 [Capsicum annuum]